MTLLIPDHPGLPTREILRAALVLKWPSDYARHAVLKRLLAALYENPNKPWRRFLAVSEVGDGQQLTMRCSARNHGDTHWYQLHLIATPWGLYETCNIRFAQNDRISTEHDLLNGPVSFAGRDENTSLPFAQPFRELIPLNILNGDFDPSMPPQMFPRPPQDGDEAIDNDGDNDSDDGDGDGDGDDGGNGNDGGGPANPGGPGGGAGPGQGLADVMRHNVLFSAPERLYDILDQL